MYFIVLALSVIPLFLVEEELFTFKKYNKSTLIKWLFFISVLLFILIAVFRTNNVGIDLENYKIYFDKKIIIHEYGYAQYQVWFHNLNKNFHDYMAFTSIITLLPIFVAIYFISSKKWLSLLMFQTLYHFVASFSLLRQFMAIALVMLAMMLIKIYLNKEDNQTISVNQRIILLLGSAILIIIAGLFHYSAYAMLGLLIVPFIKKRYWIIIAIFILSAILFVFRSEIIHFIILTFFKSKISHLDLGIEIGIFPILQFSLIILNQYIYYRKSLNDSTLKLDNEYWFVTNLSVLWLGFIFLFSWFPIFSRVTMYVSIILTAFLPKYMKYHKITYLAIITVLVSYYIFSLTLRDYQEIFPYQWVLS